jgi:hypothetical protein
VLGIQLNVPSQISCGVVGINDLTDRSLQRWHFLQSFQSMMIDFDICRAADRSQLVSSRRRREAATNTKHDEQSGLFRLDKLMPSGTMFPFDFGFLPFTRGADGDPLDVLALIDEPVPVGCPVTLRLIGANRSTANGEWQRPAQ